MEISKDVFVQQGIIDCQINQLIDFSNSDPEIKKSTSDLIRFKNYSSFKNWLNKGRIIYTLIDKENNLLGIIWFGQKEAPFKTNSNFTFAIRVYSSARGKGLAFNFMKNVFDDLLTSKTKDKITGFWLETGVENKAALHLYKKFGFKKEKENNGRVLMSFKTG